VHERSGAGEPVQDVLDAGPHALPGRSSPSRRARWPQGAGEIEQVRAFGLVELQGAGERFQHAVGDAVEVAALDPGVVGDADAGQDGDFLAAQAGDPAAAVGGQPGLLGVILARRVVKNSWISLRASTITA